MNSPLSLSRWQDALGSIGYDGQDIRRDYAFVDFEGQNSLTRTASLAAFSARPHSYRNSCVAVISSDNRNFGENWVWNHRTLGSPLIFEIKNDVVQPWSLGAQKAKLAGELFPAANLEIAFQQNRNIWNPQYLSRVKNSLGPIPDRQLDFFDVGLLPMLEGFFQKKLKSLLEKSFAETENCFREVHGAEPRSDELFAYLFRFVTAKVFQDRADVEGWSHLSDPKEILQKAISHSGSKSGAQLSQEFLDARVLNTAWHSIATTLNFQNLSIPDLAVIYEDSFINAEKRKEFGVHSTPVGLANYIIENLPWDRIPLQERRVFEPFCGHGIFLARALERLQRDLDSSLTPQQRHQYFRQMLVGVEKDALAVEVCRLILTLSDYPNDNSWELHHTDAFIWPQWEDTLASAGAVLANPPFEAFSSAERSELGARKAQPPAEMLFRLLRQPPPLLGLVLPYSFLSSPSYQEANRQIAERYEEVSLVELPPIFRYADNQTVALMASGRREKGKSVFIRFASVQKGKIEDFLERAKVSTERTATLDLEDDNKRFSLYVTPQNSIAQSLPESLPTLGSLAAIHKGINWIPRTDGEKKTSPRTDVASDTPQEGFARGAEKMRGNLSQFRIANLRYLSLLPEHQDPRTKANQRSWIEPKVVCNAGRFQADSPWRVSAWADENGFAFTKQFFAIWPYEGVSTFALAAILCSPIANAFVWERDRGRDNRIATLKQLPLPPREKIGIEGKLHKRAKDIQELLSTNEFSPQPSSKQITEALMQLDAAVLDAYDLSPHTQRHLLDQFSGWKRPVSARFDRYFPDSFKEVVSLSDYAALTYDWEELNNRRGQLIRKDIYEKNLSEMEKRELAMLENLADLKIRLQNPNPMSYADSLINKLKAEGKWNDSI